jgi:hypothetical protein
MARESSASLAIENTYGFRATESHLARHAVQQKAKSI